MISNIKYKVWKGVGKNLSLLGAFNPQLVEFRLIAIVKTIN